MKLETVAGEKTARIRVLLGEVADLSFQRRRIWYEANDAGVLQKDLAAASGVVGHTVYCEIRKYKKELEDGKVGVGKKS